VILYLHGFRSSPQSTKAQLLERLVASRAARPDRAMRWLSPQLPPSPAEAAALIDGLVGAVPAAELAVIGSSLGGFYATWLAQRRGCRAALLNPAIEPYDDLRAHLGRQTQFHGTGEFDFRPEYLTQLLALDTPVITRPERYLLVAAPGDEVIDFRTMVKKYAGCPRIPIEGSDHALSDFPLYAERVLDFCGA
jgi:predicted esterase YcpF (UPF0227 family)